MLNNQVLDSPSFLTRHLYTGFSDSIPKVARLPGHSWTFIDKAQEVAGLFESSTEQPRFLLVDNGNMRIDQNKQIGAQGGICIAAKEQVGQRNTAQCGQADGGLLLDLALEAAKQHGTTVRDVHRRLDLGYRNDRQLHGNRSITARKVQDGYILSDLLGVDGLGRDDNFFAVGGDSVISIQWSARAAAEGLPLAPQQIFDHYSIAELAAAVDEEQAPKSVNEEAPKPVAKLSPIERARARVQARRLSLSLE